MAPKIILLCLLGAVMVGCVSIRERPRDDVSWRALQHHLGHEHRNH